VRTVLVPSAMSLFGKANWYLPSWLEWLPHLSIEGTPMPLPGEAVAGAGGRPAADVEGERAA